MDALLEPKLMLKKELQCYHCGEPCVEETFTSGDKSFCCAGCQTVYELLNDHDLGSFYARREGAGARLNTLDRERYAILEQNEIANQLLDFREGDFCKITLNLPQIHCTACIWLLEKLYKLHPGVQASQVNFLRKEAYISFNIEEISLRELAELLTNIGYAPDFNLSDLRRDRQPARNWTLLYQLGVAGFAFGNSMLLSFPEYLGLDHFSESFFRSTFGYLNLALALPVVLYSARGYWRAAWANLLSGTLTIDIPITLGILTLFLRSSYEILSQTGAGYLDSLTGLVFFLLIGRWFQQKTYHRLSFERDYEAYFPIAVRLRDGTTKTVKALTVGDHILIRNGELLPADGELISGKAKLDYSFVSGESTPIPKQAGDQLYAGGRQIGQEIELRINRPITRSYLTRLWDQEAFQEDKEKRHILTTNRMGRYFTITILAIALISLLYWLPKDTGTAINVFTAVLIIACPCAIALSVPFTLGSALRLLGTRGLFLKNTNVIERFPRVTTIVFDKTGTLTENRQDLQVDFTGAPLTVDERAALALLCRQSTHPLAKAIGNWAGTPDPSLTIELFHEHTGMGISGSIKQHQFRLGSADFLDVEPLLRTSAQVFLEIDHQFRGGFAVHHQYRQNFAELIATLKSRYQLYLLSGDSDRESRFLRDYFPEERMHFRQNPEDKLHFIRQLQEQGQRVLMIGDGLNDAGALQQSDIGMVIAENTNNFTPASDAILGAEHFARIPDFMRFASLSNRMVIYAYMLAIIYNIIGLSFAVQGLLSPVIAAILMPLSSITIVAFGVLSTRWLALRTISNDQAKNDDLYHDSR